MTQNGTSTQITINQTLGDGTYNISVNCSDGSLINVSGTGSITIDILPTKVTLNSSNNIAETSPVTFNCAVNDSTGITNVTLYVWNSTNREVNTITNSSRVNNIDYIFNVLLDVTNNCKWNCYACDHVSTPNCGYATENLMFNVS
jgi:hypothetical protein